MDAERESFRWRGSNAAVGWAVVVALCAEAAWVAFEGALVWAGFAVLAAALGVAPAVARRDPTAMVPAGLLAVAAVPPAAAALGLPGPVRKAATSLAAVALAAALTLDLVAFTRTRFPPRIAGAFVVLATMAVAGAWAALQWLSDAYLGTTFVYGASDLMWGLTAATAAGLVGGPAFARYVARERAGGGGA